MDLVVVFDLEGASPDGYVRAYGALAKLGFYHVQQDAVLPATTVMGRWNSNAEITSLRAAFVAALNESGLRVSHLLVAHFNACTWLGPAAKPHP